MTGSPGLDSSIFGAIGGFFIAVIAALGLSRKVDKLDADIVSILKEGVTKTDCKNTRDVCQGSVRVAVADLQERVDKIYERVDKIYDHLINNKGL